MPSFDLLCLANSFKEGGRCVAGLRMDGRGWVRPVTSAAGAPLRLSHYQLQNGSSPQLLDVIRVGVRQHCPMPHHPENWLIDESPWRLLRRGAGVCYRPWLNQWVARGTGLLGDTRIAIAAYEFEGNPLPRSLQLIEPCDLHWRVEDLDGKKKARAIFRLGSMHYNLPLTDPNLHGVLLRREVGKYSLSETRIPGDAEPMLTLSLTEPFNGYCYKLVCALVTTAA